MSGYQPKPVQFHPCLLLTLKLALIIILLEQTSSPRRPMLYHPPPCWKVKVPKCAASLIINEEGDKDTFKVKDWWVLVRMNLFFQVNKRHSIFIAHEGLDISKRPVDPHSYWKGHINSIYLYQGQDWVVVSWFYTSSQFKDADVK